MDFRKQVDRRVVLDEILTHLSRTSIHSPIDGSVDPTSALPEFALTGHGRKPRLLMVAYRFNPHGRMEERNGWQRAILAAQAFDVTVLYNPTAPVSEMQYQLPSWVDPHAFEFVPIEHRWLDDKLVSYDLTFYSGYRRWHGLAYEFAKQLHSQNPFDLSHFVTLCGYREPGFLWRINIPFVWGPLGGTHSFPKQYIGTLGLRDAIRESVRSVINYYQLHFDRRTHQAAHNSALVLAATSSEQRAIQRGLRVSCEVDLETGIDHAIAPPRTQRASGDGFHILWSGRIRSWKGLPLLLRALTLVKNKDAISVRIMCIGELPGQLKTMASNLGLDPLIEWVPWVNYRQSLIQYRWAHAFAFTSLRDTSGTGLVESLAAGCPIIGLNHQGAADIMTTECAIPIALDRPSTSIQLFADAIERLKSDHEFWLKLSHGATQRARDFLWEDRAAKAIAMYNSVLQSVPVKT